MTRNQFTPWLKLLRIAALPSALANILVGYLLTNQSWQPAFPLFALLLSSACLYCGGMVLNDVFDYEIDLDERPSRPLPAGAISLSVAKAAGAGMLLGGIAFAAIASIQSLVFALGLAVSIYLYDGPLKRTQFAPFVMGSCRTLNILLGSSAVASIPEVAVWYAVAIGVFVAGITWLAKREANKTQSIKLLLPGSLIMVLGLLLTGFTAWKFASELDDPKIAQLLPLAIAFISLPILRRLTLAWSTASGLAVQATVITSLRSLIIFDACMALLVTNGRPMHSIVILGLVGVSWLLGRVTKLT